MSHSIRATLSSAMFPQDIASTIDFNKSIVQQAILILFIAGTIYACGLFFYFSTTTISMVALCFLAILVGLVKLFAPDLLQKPKSFSWQTTFIGVLFFLLILILNHSISSYWVDASFFRPFPLLETEVGYDWNQDTAFHVAIINSFISVGYPSIGLHDAVPLGYHVLSHFVDSLIIQLTGVDAMQSSGLFYHFRSMLLFSSILILVYSATKQASWLIMMLSLLIFGPLIILTGHAIGSHGLWVPSLIMILSAPKVFSIMNKAEELSTKDYAIIFTLIVVISLGKVSTGLMYGAFVGLFLFLKHIRDYRVYVLGIAWLGFFAFYHSLMSAPPSQMFTPSFSAIVNMLSLYSIEGLPRYYNFGIVTNILLAVYMMLLFLVGLALTVRDRNTTLILVSACLSTIMIAVLVHVRQFIGSDVWYFCYGLYSVLALFVFQLVAKLYLGVVESKTPGIEKSNLKKHAGFALGCVAILMLIQAPTDIKNLDFRDNMSLSFSSFDLLDVKESFTVRPFQKLNDKKPLLGLDEDITLFDDRELNKLSGPLQKYRDSLNKYLVENQLNKDQVLQYIPAEIFHKSLKPINGPKWFMGAYMYAVSGVPLINGKIKTPRQHYGLASYDRDALIRPVKYFDPESACQFGKDIIIVRGFSPATFMLHQCANNQQ